VTRIVETGEALARDTVAFGETNYDARDRMLD
jgi:hypothetical protein